MIMMMEGRPAGRPDCLSGVDEGSRKPGSGRVLGSARSVNVPVKDLPAQIVCVRSVNVPAKAILFTKLLRTQQMCSCKGDFIHKFTAYAANVFL